MNLVLSTKISGDKITFEDFCGDDVTLTFDNNEIKGDWAPDGFDMDFELDFKRKDE
ncbi:hypothetical protein [Butyrivibrio fibrisolvens]|uniref:hypothetical protein n=1 Tax=Butyrivibrio fibrisolvens TaxID=831 RepID=UPI0003FECE63|nr:hypothetical protein [Butyrivibrio fibrisolvens]